jgi:protein-L-isoaspartate O-methyltransferase
MKHITDWAELWRQLVERTRRPSYLPKAGEHQTARRFDARVRRKWARDDPHRELIASQIDDKSSVLDIGAGTGQWAMFLAQRARKVTAVEPSPAMLAVLRQNLVTAGVHNVAVIEGAWPQTQVDGHDFSLCSHAMYGSPDLPAFIERMVEVTRRVCYLLLRVPAPDGVMGQVAQRLWDQPHDSPNFWVAYNVLAQMGIYADVLIDEVNFRPWTSPSLEAALGKVKRHFGLEDVSEHDAYLQELLDSQLNYREGEYVWPDGMRSALVYWRVNG